MKSAMTDPSPEALATGLELWPNSVLDDEEFEDCVRVIDRHFAELRALYDSIVDCGGDAVVTRRAGDNGWAISSASELRAENERLRTGELDTASAANAEFSEMAAENKRLSMKVEQYQEQLQDKWAAHLEQLESVRERGRQLAEENERLQDFVNDLQAGMYINCVYCGHRYGPDDEVPATMADVLKEHVEQCPKHPMSALRARARELAEALKQLDDQALRLWSYCALPHDAPVARSSWSGFWRWKEHARDVLTRYRATLPEEPAAERPLYWNEQRPGETPAQRDMRVLGNQVEGISVPPRDAPPDDSAEDE